MSGEAKVISINVASKLGKRCPAPEATFKKDEVLSILSVEHLAEKPLDLAKIKNLMEDITAKGLNYVIKTGEMLKIGEVVAKVESVGIISDSSSDGRALILKEHGISCKVMREGKISVGDRITALNPLKIGVIIASDKGSKGEREDLSGRVISEMVVEIGGEVSSYAIVPDEIEMIADKIREFASQGCDIVFTSGGTGWSKRDVTPEATLKVIERLIPGIPEIMRIEGYRVTPSAVLSRGVAGILNETLVINLPGSPKGVRESLRVILPILPHGIGVLKGWEKECGKEK